MRVATAVGFLSSLGVIAASLASLILRFRRASSAEREQLKWIISAAAVLAITIFSGIPAASLGVEETIWQGAVLIGFTAVPIAAGIAILRYRLYDIDFIINRALVYGLLTAFLAGLYAAAIQLFKVVFEALTGENSDASIILTTLLLAAVFTPAKNRLQKLVDHYFGQVHDTRKNLNAFDSRLRSFVQVFNAEATARQFLEEAVEALDASSGALFLGTDGGHGAGGRHRRLGRLSRTGSGNRPQ
jgi:hypothetical protein